VTTIEDLMEVRQTLGRQFQRLENPSKTEQERYNRATSIINGAIDNMDRLSRAGKRAPQVTEHLQIKEALDSMSIPEIKAEVEAGNMDPRIAIMMEESGRNRSTLCSWLAEEITAQTEAVLG